MPASLTTEQVWREIEGSFFAVLGTVNRKGEPRTAGIVYVVRGRRLYIGTDPSSLKARNIRRNPNVSLTVTLDRRPFFLWRMKIPPAVITFRGEAVLREREEVAPEIHEKLMSGIEMSEEAAAGTVFIEVTPRGHFSTYGVGVPLRTMLRPDEAWGRVAV